MNAKSEATLGLPKPFLPLSRCLVTHRNETVLAIFCQLTDGSLQPSATDSKSQLTITSWLSRLDAREITSLLELGQSRDCFPAVLSPGPLALSMFDNTCQQLLQRDKPKAPLNVYCAIVAELNKAAIQSG